MDDLHRRRTGRRGFPLRTGMESEREVAGAVESVGRGEGRRKRSERRPVTKFPRVLQIGCDHAGVCCGKAGGFT